ncbi:TPA: flagellar hook-associated protein FlgK, partial [bacterium]|nr:flagellar hook-associated protein FlgK [bacterium]
YRKIAASSSSTGLPGDNTNALNIIKLAEENLSELGGKTFTGFYKGIVSDVATLTSSAYDSLTFDAKLLKEISMRRESISGVSLEEEAANLIKYQRAFEAGARIIKVTDELLQTVINL